MGCIVAQGFFKSCKRALKKDGILCTQGECMWLHVKIIAEVRVSIPVVGII